MTGRKVCVLLRLMWTVFIPLSLVFIFSVVLAQYTVPQYGYEYRPGAIAIGLFIGLTPIAAVILIALVVLLKGKGNILQRLKKSLKPSDEWVPHNREAAEEYTEKPYTYPDTWWKFVSLNIKGDKENPFF